MLTERITDRCPLGVFGGGGDQINPPIGGNGSRTKMQVRTVERSGVFHVPFIVVRLLVGDDLPFHLFELALGGCRVVLNRSGVRLDLHINIGRETICCRQERLDNGRRTRGIRSGVQRVDLKTVKREVNRSCSRPRRNRRQKQSSQDNGLSCVLHKREPYIIAGGWDRHQTYQELESRS